MGAIGDGMETGFAGWTAGKAFLTAGCGSAIFMGGSAGGAGGLAGSTGTTAGDIAGTGGACRCPGAAHHAQTRARAINPVRKNLVGLAILKIEDEALALRDDHDFEVLFLEHLDGAELKVAFR